MYNLSVFAFLGAWEVNILLNKTLPTYPGWSFIPRVIGESVDVMWNTTNGIQQMRNVVIRSNTFYDWKFDHVTVRTKTSY